MVVASTSLLWITNNTTTIESWIKKVFDFLPEQYLKLFAEAAPGLALSVVQAAVPAVVNKITKEEKYDYADTTITQRIIRIYIMNILSTMIVIVAMIFHMLYVADETEKAHYHEAIFFANGTAMETDGAQYLQVTSAYNKSKIEIPLLPYSEFDCVEDETAMNITNTVFTGIIIKVGTILATTFISVYIKGVILNQNPKKWKKDFSVPGETVGLISFQLMTYFLSILFPPMIIISPFLYFMLFKAMKLQLQKYSIKPESSSPDEGTAVTVYFLQFLTYNIFQVFVVFFGILQYDKLSWLSSEDKNCGPYSDNENLESEINNIFFSFTSPSYTDWSGSFPSQLITFLKNALKYFLVLACHPSTVFAITWIAIGQFYFTGTLLDLQKDKQLQDMSEFDTDKRIINNKILKLQKRVAIFTA